MCKFTKMKTYKFRAECSTDVIHFFRAMADKTFDSVHIKSQELEGNRIPDVDVVFKSSNSLAKLIQAAKQIDDFHVIAQTIRPISKYTGERNYNI